MARRSASPEERFHKRVIIPDDDGCWGWDGSRNGNGYPQFAVNKRLQLVHRWSYEHFIGPIPEGAVIDHMCHGPECTLGTQCPHRACVNPWHLRPTTNGENVLRGAGPAARAARATHCPHGHPLSAENLYVKPATGARMCRECNRESNRRWVRKMRDSAVSPPESQARR